METKRLYTQIEIKAVDAAQRLITGHAAAIGNKDRTGDTIDKGAFGRTLKENPDVLALIGHDASRLPVGEPVSMAEDAKGLQTVTRIYNTAAGDELLEVAKERMSSGRTLGMSIGYRTVKQKYIGNARHLQDVDLLEYSFLASPNLAANPEATVTGVKDARSTAVDLTTLPDDAFAYVEPGGAKDDEQKTVPRATRHFAHHAADGSLDTDMLTAAIADAAKSAHGEKAIAHLHRHALKAGIPQTGPDDTHAQEWSRGAAPTLLAVGVKLLALAEDLATDHGAMQRLGLDTKNGDRLNSDARARLQDLHANLGQVLEWADSIERGEDGKMRVEMFKHRLEMLTLEEVS